MNIQFLFFDFVSPVLHTRAPDCLIFLGVYFTRTKAVESVISRSERRPFSQMACLDLSHGALLDRWPAGGTGGCLLFCQL
jgi:hypothetical protein